jgi:hypothetical protein
MRNKKQHKVVNGEVFPLDKSLLMGDPIGQKVPQFLERLWVGVRLFR